MKANTVFFVLLLSACSKAESKDTPAPSASAIASVAPASASAVADAGAPAAAGATGSFAGTYSLAPAAIHIGETKDYANVKQVKDDPSKNVGDGALAIAIAPDGKVTGTIDSGPASPAIIDGTLMDGEVRGVVRRKNPKDDGLTGTLIANLKAAEGKLSLAESSAAIVREGKVTLKAR